jgi:hypothetical protein
MTLKTLFAEYVDTKSDINEHLETLKKYADESDHITEMGVRGGISTVALLMGKPFIMVSYDIVNCDVTKVTELSKGVTDFRFIQGDSLKIVIEPTDLLFIDTLHNYTQLSQELALHADKVSNYIIFHDTMSFRDVGESYTGVSDKGILPAILEFLAANQEWKIVESFTNNNGLTVIGRT